jgi:hypothetical protein
LPPDSDASAYPPDSIPPGWSAISPLPYDVVSAAFSVPSSLLVITSDQPTNALHFYSPTSGTDLKTVPLPGRPGSMAMDSTGSFVAVGVGGVGTASVAVVELSAGTLKVCALPSSDSAIALSAGGTIAYVASWGGQWLSSVDMSTCAAEAPGGEAVGQPRILLDSAQSSLFVADDQGRKLPLTRCAVPSTIGPFSCDTLSLSPPDLDVCGNLWGSGDGTRLYTACGVTLSVPDGDAGAATYVGTFPDTSLIGSLFEAPDAQRVVLLSRLSDPSVDPAFSAPANADTVVRVYDTALHPVAAYQLPAFPAAGQPSPSHALFVFATPKLDAIYAVVQSGPTYQMGGPFAVATIKP